MAQTEIIKTKVPLMKPTNSRTPVEVGDTVTLILHSDEEEMDPTAAYNTVDVVLTYADELNREYGWDRATTDYRSLDIKRAHHKHTPQCS